MKNARYVKFAGYAVLSLFFATTFVVVTHSASAEPQAVQVTQTAQPDGEDSLWTIDTRTAAYRRGTPLAEAGVRVLKKVHNCWVDASRDELAAADQKMPLIVFFHGMWLDQAGGREEGMRLYRLLKQHQEGRPFQFVIWSWPAMRQQFAPRKDVRVKVARTDTQAFYAAQWLETLPADRPICLVGYSLGARIVSGSLELLAGGTVGGQSLQSLTIECPEEEVHVLRGPHESATLQEVSYVQEVSQEMKISPRRPLRVALVAAAIDNGSFLPGHRNGLALSQVERMVVTRNSSDHVLRWYPMLNGCGGPEALGATGPACLSRFGEESNQLEVLSVSCSVGRDHYWMSYLRSCALRHELVELALEPVEEEVEVVPAE